MVILSKGTKVRIKDDLVIGVKYGDNSMGESAIELLECMKYYLGKDAVITESFPVKGVYRLDDLYWWHSSMFTVLSPKKGGANGAGYRTVSDRKA